MKKVVIGALAHVDAGKTTLSESLLYQTHIIKECGRVDNGNAYLDTHEQERKRGITIFSSEAQFDYGDTQFMWVDTPGHIDFSAEMERTLQVLDYAIIVINGLDGVQSHTLTIWKLLEQYHISVFLFVNKMDMSYFSQEELMDNIKTKLSENCLNFQSDDLFENMAMCSDLLLNEYIDKKTIGKSLIIDEIHARHIFPCYFGSAIKMTGIDDFLKGLSLYTKSQDYSHEFGARVFKITHDESGNRLTHIKLTGGSLKVKDRLLDDVKIDQI
ncbi:MAG: GTP-binding protein, partial [Coprobacillus sp.]